MQAMTESEREEILIQSLRSAFSPVIGRSFRRIRTHAPWSDRKGFACHSDINALRLIPPPDRSFDT